ncbi:hypothetical protein CPB83DRAFT_814913 [Crepidotus variabilis]|uniref:RRM domain-containing protein n=1 Tax=Crepidotus variabilis TaxID=179855 RepID=A0A9P6EEU8_9AGAR|nr:hypothetical protein CPB83DRAFT_814913 [Crepidotus variabilis]
MSIPPKLTKKQKKGLAFRERKGKSTSTSTSSKHSTLKKNVSDLDHNAYPAMEDQDLLGLDGGEGEVRGDEDEKQGEEGKDKERNEEERKESGKIGKGKRKAATEDVHVPVAVLKDGKGKKRKREEGEGVEENKETEAGGKKGSNKTKRKKVDGEAADTGDQNDSTKQRFILFVGNLKYTTTKDAITKHFVACDPPPSVRLLTPKAKPGAPATPKHKSKGCAFLEFTHRNALQQALKLHQSNLEGRMINVELTAGGGGKSESRIAKVRERNKVLLGQRAEQEQNGEPTSFPDQPQKPQRFSMTSGLEQMPTSKKTWTVGDIDDGQTHRGGERHRGKKKSKTNSKAWGTGVNAIPVG